ncbi:UPF0041-domain-containing protein [Teratosphaeria nubilosa]|uniref:Mitochondrial pyruvate carrier n=1 Tax=Teratosphaeria nubilosa TaxID=161662 RepID=A0A6G1KZJ0_9PEZI|nr:UPF0041-domain-containing protein [Teratosphaeria nubilosa]
MCGRADFWGPASNFGIPAAAVMDTTTKDPDIISGTMTAALVGYSGVFMRYSMAVTPKNYLLFGCHFVNFGAQLTQAYRYTNYWYMGGREKSLEAKAKEGLTKAEDVAGQAGEIVQAGVQRVEGGAKEVAEQAKGAAKAVQEKVGGR